MRLEKTMQIYPFNAWRVFMELDGPPHIGAETMRTSDVARKEIMSVQPWHFAPDTWGAPREAL